MIKIDTQPSINEMINWKTEPIIQLTKINKPLTDDVPKLLIQQLTRLTRPDVTSYIFRLNVKIFKFQKRTYFLNHFVSFYIYIL